MRRHPVKENQIGSAVSEILRYTQTNKQTDRHPVTLVQGLPNLLQFKQLIHCSFLN